MVAMIIRNVPLNCKIDVPLNLIYTKYHFLADIQKFEQTFIRTLSEAKAELMFSRSMNNMLAHVEPHTQQAYVLNLRG